MIAVGIIVGLFIVAVLTVIFSALALGSRDDDYHGRP